jgi:hypothetical protein
VLSERPRSRTCKRYSKPSEKKAKKTKQQTEAEYLIYQSVEIGGRALRTEGGPPVETRASAPNLRKTPPLRGVLKHRSVSDSNLQYRGDINVYQSHRMKHTLEDVIFNDVRDRLQKQPKKKIRFHPHMKGNIFISKL